MVGSEFLYINFSENGAISQWPLTKNISKARMIGEDFTNEKSTRKNHSAPFIIL
jgi:hypothetical protein